MTTKAKDLLGNVLTKDERELLGLYARLKVLSQRTDLPQVARPRTASSRWCSCGTCATTSP